ncbi:glycoside hydrolase family 2 TIM barrel-domain containing protein [Flavobacterium psychrotrophum]|uniref:glycoside hydrolase family 2 TIM barrel-domain containing protein n=1 Tax=Flavobacterium psychrotrophum TaxID=2294119 RepID=UPI000E31499C|nr:glycoside hydrolase family 2 TIM barrel-domain containing protein [Flavobacterium psychrotrophum]
MIKKLLFIFAAISLQCGYAQQKASKTLIREYTFDKDWLFFKGTVSDAQTISYQDKSWKKVELPHDWTIEDLPEQKNDSVVGPFKRTTNSLTTGYTIGGTGWYRKHFKTSELDKGKIVSIYFDGVYNNSDIYINGQHLGRHPHGYTAFYYDITPYLNPQGQDNVLAVCVRNEGSNSRWYSGSGLYRHVSLIRTDYVHVAPWGIAITTPRVSNNSSDIAMTTVVNNYGGAPADITIHCTILDTGGNKVSEKVKSLAITGNGTGNTSFVCTVDRPELWSVDRPYLYKAVTELRVGKKVIDKVETPFGIRSISANAKTGFLLNGKKVILKGGCIHHDNGPLGAAAIDRAEERKIELLKQNGYNAVRMSHNPPSKIILDACDRLGMLVINEAFDQWEIPKSKDDYHLNFKEWWKSDLRSMIYRDRNHPSIIMWSIGNEITERVDTLGLRITKELAQETRRLDPTRFVTEALCEYWEPANKGKDWSLTAPAFELLDIAGYNYLWQKYEADHKKFPERIIVGAETLPSAALANYTMAEKFPYVIGDFVWTAFEYIGEASVGNTIYDSKKRKRPVLGWPFYTSGCGDLDITGQKKPQSYYRDVVWRNKPIAIQVHRPIPEGKVENISRWGWPDEIPSWSWAGHEGNPFEVRVFSRAPLVKLLLNGEVVGEHIMREQDSITATFTVPYKAGVLKAVNVENGRETAEIILKSTGAPHHLRLNADRSKIYANRNDLSYVTLEILDHEGNVIPEAAVDVEFSIEGGGEIVAVANGNPRGVRSFKSFKCTTFQGKCLAIIRPFEKKGKIILHASGKDIKESKISITVN